MVYSGILKKYIKESGKSLVAIVNECSKYGISITTSYLSKLKNGKLAPPKDNISRVLATVLNCDPDILLVAAYREKIPSDILQKLILYEKSRMSNI